MKYNAIWISDVHLGTYHSKVKSLVHFLKENESNHLYIVGDFIDGWELKHKWFWTPECNTLIQKLLRKDRKNTKITIIHGNHDEFMVDFPDIQIGNIKIVDRAIYNSINGKQYLILHGHQFDGLTKFNRILEKIGTHVYNILLDINLVFNRITRKLGFGYWSLSAYLKMKAKGAMQYIMEYEETMVQMAEKHNVDGIICGHIHRPEIKTIKNIEYMNCGDWVESCSALTEDIDGNFKIIYCFLE